MTSRPHDETLDEPPAKRKKTETDEVQKSPEFWFSSGNLVFVANGTTAFRVHGDVLGQKSQVFNDMLTLEASRPVSEDTMEGCPVIHLTDNPDDFKTFLRLIYVGLEHIEEYAMKLRWNLVRPMIVLGDKYDVPMFREKGLAALYAYYAKDVKKWDLRNDKFLANDRSGNLEVARVTRMLDDKFLHAAVLYECCMADVASMVSGPNALLPDDLIRTLEFTQTMREYWRDMILILVENLEVCNKCSQSWESLHSEAEHWLLVDMDGFSYRYLHKLVWDSMMDHLKQMGFAGFCKRCERAYKVELRRLRQEQRDQLPKYLRLVNDSKK